MQLDDAETAISDDPPDALTRTCLGETENSHGAGGVGVGAAVIAVCVTVTTSSAIVNVPVRSPPVFAATRYFTAPGPTPLVSLNSIHDV